MRSTPSGRRLDNALRWLRLRTNASAGALAGFGSAVLSEPVGTLTGFETDWCR